jgi:hypothetical protein
LRNTATLLQLADDGVVVGSLVRMRGIGAIPKFFGVEPTEEITRRQQIARAMRSRRDRNWAYIKSPTFTRKSADPLTWVVPFTGSSTLH